MKGKRPAPQRPLHPPARLFPCDSLGLSQTEWVSECERAFWKGEKFQLNWSVFRHPHQNIHTVFLSFSLATAASRFLRSLSAVPLLWIKRTRRKNEIIPHALGKNIIIRSVRRHSLLGEFPRTLSSVVASECLKSWELFLVWNYFSYIGIMFSCNLWSTLGLYLERAGAFCWIWLKSILFLHSDCFDSAHSQMELCHIK